MATGLIALLDDVAAIAKLAAASLDDVGAAAGRAGAKAAGVVVDDAAVTPNYVAGLSPDRELPIIWAITRGSLRNKLVFLLPGALLLSALLPGAITPLLMIGGAYLCYEGTEKLAEALGLAAHHGDPADAEDDALDPAELEAARISGAVRTDFILSAEIMAIALASVATEPLLTRGTVLALVAVGITFAVYGTVGLIVKLDDIGLHMVRRGGGVARAVGRGLIGGMPRVMAALSSIGTAAMLWVGGQIELHGLEVLGWGAPQHLVHGIADAVGRLTGPLAPVVAWLVNAALSACAGIIVGSVVVGVIALVRRLRRRR